MTDADLNLDTIRLDRGEHDGPDDGACLMEVVSMFAGQKFTDNPPCVSPVLRNFGISLNDRWDDEQRQTLKRFVPLLPGTAGDGQDEARSYLALDWLVRTFTPAWLDLAGLTDAAGELRGLRRITDMAAANAAGPVVREAQKQSNAAWDAAGDDAWDDAGNAAWDAARAAARAAAWDAARDAAGAAAGAGADAGAAARAALAPTVAALQASALDLFAAMIDPCRGVTL